MNWLATSAANVGHPRDEGAEVVLAGTVYPTRFAHLSGVEQGISCTYISGISPDQEGNGRKVGTGGGGETSSKR